MVIISLMILIIAIALTPSPLGNVTTNESPIYSAPFGDSVSAQEPGVETGTLNTEGGISPILITRLTSIVFLFSGALSYNALYIQSIGSGLSIYSGLFHVTVLSQSFDIILFILASLILIPWSNNLILLVNKHKELDNITNSNMSQGSLGVTSLPYLGGGSQNIISYLTGPIVSEYSLIVLFTTLGSSLLLSSGNLLSLYLAIELQSFGVYILATIYRNSESATNAGLKYFLLGGLSSCLILLGCVLIYSYTGVIYFEDIYSLVTSSVSAVDQSSIDILGNTPLTIVQLGLILIFIGFLFKIAGAPFHNWAPDVYSDVPTIVTTWLTIMPKIAIIILSFDIISTINLDNLLPTLYLSTYGPIIKNLLLISSLLSLIIGTIVGLAQIKIKRLLAYSTISHVGFLLLALSINTEDSLESLLFYLIQYSFTNLNTFFILLSFGYIIKKSINITLPKGLVSSRGLVSNKAQRAGDTDINLISELKGQFWANPLLSLSLAICLFSMAGIPPLMGFFAKAQVLYSATQNGYYFISIIAILVSVISAYYYLQIIRVLHFDTPMPKGISDTAQMAESYNQPVDSTAYINNTHSFIISTLTLSLLLFMLKPSIILNSIHLMALNIFYS